MHKRKGRLEWKELRRREEGKGVVGGMKGGGGEEGERGMEKVIFYRMMVM